MTPHYFTFKLVLLVLAWFTIVHQTEATPKIENEFRPLRLATAAFREEGVIVALARDEGKNSVLMDKLFSAVRDETDPHDPAGHFIFNQRTHVLRIEQVFTKHRLPRRVFVVGVEGGIQHRNVHGNNSEIYRRPQFLKSGERWLVFLQSVRSGASLSSDEKTKRFFEQLREKEVFTKQNVFRVFAKGAAFRVLDPGGEALPHEFTVSPKAIADVKVLKSQVQPYAHTLQKENLVPSHQKITQLIESLKSEFAKNLAKHLFEEAVMNAKVIQDISIEPERVKKKGGEVMARVKIADGIEVKALSLLLKQRKQVAYQKPLQRTDGMEGSWYQARIHLKPASKRNSIKQKKGRQGKVTRIRRKRRRFGEQFWPLVRLTKEDDQLVVGKGQKIVLGRPFRKARKRREKRR